MKGRPRKEKEKKEVALPLEKEKGKTLPKLADSPKEEPINVEAIEKHPVIQDLGIKVAALGEALSGSFNQVTVKFQEYDTQIKNTDEKITALGQAVSILNEEFSNFMKTLQTKLAGNPPGENTPPGVTAVSSERVNLEKPAPTPAAPEATPPSTGDKLLQWANLLAGLAGSGQPSSQGGGGGGVNATDLLKLVLQLQDNAEERALKRTESSIKNIAAIANLLIGKKVEVPMETANPEKAHL